MIVWRQIKVYNYSIRTLKKPHKKLYKKLSFVNKTQDQFKFLMKSLSILLKQYNTIVDSQSIKCESCKSEVCGLKENLPRLIIETLND